MGGSNVEEILLSLILLFHFGSFGIYFGSIFIPLFQSLSHQAERPGLCEKEEKLIALMI